MKKIFSLAVPYLLTGLLLVPQLSLAQGLKGGLGAAEEAATQAYGATPQTDPQIIAGRIIRGMLTLVGVIFMVLMVYAGYLWMTARGESEQVEKSKRILIQSIIGLAIVLMAYAITAFVISKLQSATVQ